MFKSAALLAAFMLSAAHLSGCAMASAGMKKGDERSFVGSLNDLNAGRAVQARLKRAYAYELGGVDVEVAEGVVLLSGYVPRQEDRIEAARIAWSAPNIIQVGNEIMLQEKQGFFRNTKDGLLEKSVRARLTADKYVRARNFNVETHEGIVYLMGVARDPGELDRAAKIAALTRGTREVISYVRLADRPIEEQLDGANAQAGAAQGGGQASSQAGATLRPLPDFMTTEPLPDMDRGDVAAPMRRAPMGESVPYQDPQSLDPYSLGQSGNPLNADPNAAPFYVDPETGEQIRVRNWVPQNGDYMGD